MDYFSFIIYNDPLWLINNNKILNVSFITYGLSTNSDINDIQYVVNSCTSIFSIIQFYTKIIIYVNIT